MRLHAENRVDDGVFRHPTDSHAWKYFDDIYPYFASGAHNLRLGLAADGFNPFRSISISHSTWPVIVIPYNLPPWLCMKQDNFILSVLTQGPKEPGYANLSGWSTNGEYACPICNKRPQAHWLKNGRKWCYIGHMRFLPNNQNFRKDKKAFNGAREVRSKLKLLSDNYAKKTNTLADLEELQGCIPFTLYQLKKIFPPSFFDVMEHLSVHLADEAILCSIVLFHWMYPVERMHLSILKRTLPRSQAHRIQTEHNQNFDTWIKDYVCTTKDVIPDDVKVLSLGPHMDARRFKGYLINGFPYRIKEVDARRNSQNSGVMLSASVTSFASRKDNNPVTGDMNFYGKLNDIIEIRYSNSLKYTLFKCNWVDQHTGVMKDPFKFILVNHKNMMYKEIQINDEPFVLATQAEQVWFIQDPIDTDCSVVMRMTGRDNFDNYTNEESTKTTRITQIQPFNVQDFDKNVADVDYLLGICCNNTNAPMEAKKHCIDSMGD
ncbi:uncharacterized protein LOC141718588 [Apium graveolens]|uniref:uncharacterized protein LOC141718588 n=1 Tax=Apium graveolens TaxID=4045 RepID=UPI003D7A1B37